VSEARWGTGEDWPFLARLPPGPNRLPRELVRDNQRRRILLGALDVFSERGFAAATVKDLIKAAHVSRASFYEVFADKEACMAALQEEILGWLSEQVEADVAASPDWASRVRVAVVRSVELLGDDPRLPAVCAVEAPAIHAPVVRARHAQLVEQLCDGLRIGRRERAGGEQLPKILEPALVSGAIYMIGRSIVHRREPESRELGTELAELMLLPYLG